MLENFVQFCAQWIGTDPRWTKFVVVLMIVFVVIGPRKTITIKKGNKDKWTIFKN